MPKNQEKTRKTKENRTKGTMGLASSQARLLNLTARLHQIEYKSQRLEAQKLQMANESTHVYEDYLNALDATKIQQQVLTTDGSITYVDATYNSLIDAGYKIKFQGEDRIPISESTRDHYLAACDEGGENYFVYLETGKSGAPDGYEPIYTSSQLQNMSSSGKYILMSDIDVSKLSDGWTTISSFKGTLDGNGHTITGLTSALFDTVNGATIENLKLSNVNINSDSQYTGALANQVKGNTTISDVSVSGSITSSYTSSSKTASVGGLVGYIANGSSNITISDISSSVNISYTGSGSGCVGGVVGYIEDTYSTTIDNATYSGTLTAGGTNSCVGGILGLTMLEYSSCQLTISNCSTSGYATDESELNGAITRGAGGIIGACWAVSADAAIIENCSSSMDVTSANQHAGGITAYLNGTIKDSYSKGNVSSSSSVSSAGVGGIVGDLSYIGVIDNCYSETVVSNNGGSAKVGTIAGYLGNTNGVYGQITNSSSSNTTYNETGSNVTGVNDDNDCDDASALKSIASSVTGATTSTAVVEDDSEMAAARELWKDINEYGWVLETEVQYSASGHENDTQWLTNMINEGILYIYKKETSTGDYVQVSVSTDTGLQEVSDEVALKKAEAKYEADMKKIDLKDRKYDTDLAAVETEREAIVDEIDTLKTVAKDDVDRTFKLFS